MDVRPHAARKRRATAAERDAAGTPRAVPPRALQPRARRGWASSEMTLIRDEGCDRGAERPGERRERREERKETLARRVRGQRRIHRQEERRPSARAEPGTPYVVVAGLPPRRARRSEILACLTLRPCVVPSAGIASRPRVRVHEVPLTSSLERERSETRDLGPARFVVYSCYESRRPARATDTLTTSEQARLPAEFKHITKRRKRN